MSRTNFGGPGRLAVEFAATIVSGSAVSTPFPHPLGLYGLGTVTPSGAIPATSAHIGIQAMDAWNLWRPVVDYEGGLASALIVAPSAGAMHAMPPSWFGICGSARLMLVDSSGSGLPATGTQHFAVSMKA